MRIGILGAGQLGQMLGFAARDLNAQCHFLDPSENPPAAECGEVMQRAFDDPAALAELAEACDVITYEFENVPIDALLHLDGKVPVYPPPAALQHSQDRLREKKLFAALDIPLPDYHAIDTRKDLDAAAQILGLPMIVKTRRLGYDGKGQFVVNDRSDVDAAWNELGGRPLIAEQWVSFDFEVSCIGVRSINGYVRRLLQQLDYVGVLTLELFVVGDELLANEFAPRVHNSGHWSIEGSKTSQFENHLRAVMNLPLGSTASCGHAGMVNLIGEIPQTVRALDVGVLHDYGKMPKPGRKLGHVTVIADSANRRDALVEIIDNCITE